MGGRRDLVRRLRALGDIGAILGVMKNLALMEIGKLSRILPAQREMVDSLEATAADFLAFHPQPGPAPGDGIEVRLLVGSQWGFCGEFNDLLVTAVSALGEDGGPKPLRIAVGGKLAGRLPADLQLNGPHAVEETGEVLHEVMKALGTLLSRADGVRPFRVVALHHDPDTGGVVVRQLSPFPEQATRPSLPHFPPHLNIPPAAFFAQLTEQHLLASLTGVFHRSLMAECRFRLNHIEGASSRLERRTAELKRKQLLLRQEEIIEEIEAILAAAEASELEADASTNGRKGS